MSRTYRLMVLILVLVAPAEASKNKEGPVRDFTKLEHGMTPEQVRELVGAPQQIARQIYYHHYREQWMYDAPLPVRLTFDCPRGQKPRLLAPVNRRSAGR